MSLIAEHRGGPAQGVGIHGGDGAFGETQLVLDHFAAMPVAGFEAADEVEGAAAGAFVAGKSGFHLRRDGEGLEDAIEGSFEEHVEQGEETEEVKLGGLGGERWRDEFAKLSAGEGEGDERGGTMGGQSAGHGHRDHLANGVVADHEQGLANGGDHAGVPLEGGVG